MNLRRSFIIFILFALLAVHYHSQTAGAAHPTPGTAGWGDPLITKSYLDRYLAEVMGELKEQVAYLKSETKKLDERIKRLEARLIQPVTLTLGQAEAKQGEQIMSLAKAPYVKENRVMLPFRFIGEVMGAGVTWDGVAKQATFQRGSQKVSLTIGARQAEVNGRTVELDVAPELVDGVTMVPLRFVADGLGARVEWLPEQKQVILRP
ncbi:MAG: copper amine oxidase N-terminal domain-containing protein [Clostridia bacterium]|nr:copper amine oxidase N-terminal domain-containing protein [Clostridia bacterium]